MADVRKVIEALNKRYGRPIVQTGSTLNPTRKICLDIPAYDYVTDGGIPINRITELYGDFSSLKSYMMYKAIAKFQKYDWANHVTDVIQKVEVAVTKASSRDEANAGFTFPEIKSLKLRRGYKPKQEAKAKYCVLVDIESTYDRAWGEKLGIDNDFLIYVPVDSLNDAVDIVIALLSTEEVCLVCIDSMIAIGCDAEADASMTDEQMAINARFWNKATRNIQRAMNANPSDDITLIAINGAYDKVGAAYGDPEKVKNGKAFSLAKSVSIKSSALKTHTLKIEGKGEITAGRNITIRNKKNKCGVPLREATFYYSFIDDGLLSPGETDIYQQLIELALTFGIVSRSGAWYSFGETKLGSGLENVKNALKTNTEQYNEIKASVYNHFNQ